MGIADRVKLAAVVGPVCAGVLLYNVPRFEGTILRGYRDPIGVVTACTGHTATAVLGKPYTVDECRALLDSDLVDASQRVLTCTPELKGRTYQLAAATSLAFNIGGPAYCRSTIAKKFNSGDYAGACADFSRWVYAGGRVLPGLVSRRAVERQMCEGKIG